jgi:pyrroline-5-carboxylate reductase
VIAILGAGQMGEALLSGLLRSGVVQPSEIIAAARRSERAQQLRDAYGIEVMTAAEAAAKAQTLVITVKPQDMSALLDEIGSAVTPGKLIVSVAAGITTAFIGRRLAGNVPVVRVMSNAPAAGGRVAPAGGQGAADPRVSAGRGDRAVR